MSEGFETGVEAQESPLEAYEAKIASLGTLEELAAAFDDYAERYGEVNQNGNLMVEVPGGSTIVAEDQLNKIIAGDTDLYDRAMKARMLEILASSPEVSMSPYETYEAKIASLGTLEELAKAFSEFAEQYGEKSPDGNLMVQVSGGVEVIAQDQINKILAGDTDLYDRAMRQKMQEVIGEIEQVG